jgi:hypothetical protein
MTETLFPDLEPAEKLPADIPAEPKLSADRRRTLRQRADVERGRNPLTRRPIRQPPGETCGSCRHREIFGHHNRTYPKCTVNDGVRETHGPASDVRAWWPACQEWEAKP